MSKHRRAAKIDNSENQIVKELRQIPGMSVEPMHDDIICGYKGETFWYDLKNPEDVSPKTGKIRPSKLTDNDKRRLRDFKGHFKICWSVDQILKDIGVIK